MGGGGGGGGGGAWQGRRSTIQEEHWAWEQNEIPTCSSSQFQFVDGFWTPEQLLLLPMLVVLDGSSATQGAFSLNTHQGRCIVLL